VVIVLSHKSNRLVGVVPSHLEFFSFRDNMWKEIEGTHVSYIDVYKDGEGVPFSGAVHWLALRHDLRLDVIVAFDLMERKLFEMPVPNDFDKKAFLFDGLWVFGEFLSLWAMDNVNDTTVIWVMKEYKMHSSWTKTLVLSVDAIPNHFFQPIYSTKNGDIIGRNLGTRLVKYNDKGQLLWQRSFCKSPYEIGMYTVVIYTESLLSLLGDNEHH
jgi:F-box interacting protein